MKKVFILLTLLVGVTVNAAPFKSFSLINGSDVVIPLNTTHSFGDRGVFYTKPNGDKGFSLTATNVTAAGVTNVATYTNVPAAWGDVPLWSDANGNPATVSITVKLTGNNAANSTNFMTFVFGAMGAGKETPTQAQNKWTWGVMANGTTPVVITTNPPSGFLNGCGGLRLLSINANNVSSSVSVTVNSITCNGFVP